MSKAPVGSYEDAFNEIIDATGITELTELVSGFIDLEDTNFDIFNNVNALSAECDRMEKHVVEIKGEVEKLKGNGMNADNQRKKMLKELEDRLRAVETELELYERNCDAATKTVCLLIKRLDALRCAALRPKHVSLSQCLVDQAFAIELRGANRFSLPLSLDSPHPASRCARPHPTSIRRG